MGPLCVGICSAVINQFNISLIDFIYHQQKSLMKPYQILMQQQIDQQLKNQYHEICFNPKKRDVLLRLTDGNEQLAEEGFVVNGELSNSLLKRYIHGVYLKYGIQDPIKREFRLAKQNDSLSITINGSPEKSLNQTQVTQSDRLTKTKRKLINLKSNFKQDSNQVISSSKILQTEGNLSLRESSFHINRSRMSRQIGYRTKEKIYFKTLPKDDVIREIPKPIVKHLFSVERSDHSKITISFNNPEAVSPKKEIPVVFRYCPMCQQSILQNNISFHEAKCKDIQMAYQMPYSQIQQIVLNKIQRLQREIVNEFINKDERAVINQYNRLKDIVASWVAQRSNPSFDVIRSGFLNLAGRAHDKISKLNWFKNLHKKIMVERSFQSR